MDAGSSLENVPIDHGWAWMALLGAAISSFFFVGGIRSLGILLVEIVTRFSATSAEASLILAIVSVGVAVVAPLSASLGERFTFRLVIMVGGVFCSLGCFLTGFATNTIFVVLVYGTLTGIGFGCIAGPSLVVVGHYFNKRRALANGLAVSGGSVGQLVIPLLMRYLFDEYGFRGGLIIYSAISLHVVSGALLMRPFSFFSPKRKTHKSNEQHLGYSDTEKIAIEDKREEVKYRAGIDETSDSAPRVVFQMLQREDSNNLDGENVELTDLQMYDNNYKVLLPITGTNIREGPSLENGNAILSKVTAIDAGLCTNQHYPNKVTSFEQICSSHNAAKQEDEVGLAPQSGSTEKSLSSENIQGVFLTVKDSDPDSELCEEQNADSELEMQSNSGLLDTDQNRNLHSCPKMRHPTQRMKRVERQASILSWVSVRSLEVAPHQEIPEVPVAEIEYGLQCPQDLLVNFCCCLPSTPTVSHPLIPWYMFKDPLFILYILGMCLGNTGYMNAGLFFPAHAEYDVKLTRSTATWLLSIMGIVDLVGRIGGGWFADLGYISRSRILAGCLLITGVATYICIPFQSYAALTAFSIVMGLVGGCCVSMQTVVLVDFFGAEKLSATCGLSIMIQGLTNIFVPSLLGIVRDCTGSYNLSYYICATLMIIAGILFNFETCVRARRHI